MNRANQLCQEVIDELISNIPEQWSESIETYRERLKLLKNEETITDGALSNGRYCYLCGNHFYPPTNTYTCDECFGKSVSTRRPKKKIV